MTRDEQVELIYLAYPRKVAKGAAKKAIAKALAKVEFETLMEAVDEYAKACRSVGKEKDYIPHAATWFNREQWDDDRTEWWRGASRPSIREANDAAFREVFGE